MRVQVVVVFVVIVLVDEGQFRLKCERKFWLGNEGVNISEFWSGDIEEVE